MTNFTFLGLFGLFYPADTDADADADTDGGPDESISIIGTWVNERGETNTISDEDWVIDYPALSLILTFDIFMHDNDGQYVVLQNPDVSELSESMRGLWSRLDWIWSDDVLYYCWSISDAETSADTLVDLIVDHDAVDLTSECNERPWSTLSPL